MSDEELRQLSAKKPGWQLERWKDGGLIVSPIGGESDYLEALLLGQLYRWKRQRGLGLVFRPRGSSFPMVPSSRPTELSGFTLDAQELFL